MDRRARMNINNNGDSRNNSNMNNFGEGARKKQRLTSHDGFVAEKPHLTRPTRPTRLGRLNGQIKNKTAGNRLNIAGNGNTNRAQRVGENTGNRPHRVAVNNEEILCKASAENADKLDKVGKTNKLDKLSKFGKCRLCKQVRRLGGMSGTCFKPCFHQKTIPISTCKSSISKSLSIVNIDPPAKKDTHGTNRLDFFLHQPSAYVAGKKLSQHAPFSYAASIMPGFKASSVCAVCGNGDKLGFKCKRCKLAFHNICITKPDGETSGLCQACAPTPDTIKGDDGILKDVIRKTSCGNPMDLVLHPTLHAMFTRQYCADWLRCVKCRLISPVHPGVLSECVKIPFECKHAFWKPAHERECNGNNNDGKKKRKENPVMKAAAEHINKQIKTRPRRRNSLFEAGFGEKNRELFASSNKKINDENNVKGDNVTGDGMHINAKKRRPSSLPLPMLPRPVPRRHFNIHNRPSVPSLPRRPSSSTAPPNPRLGIPTPGLPDRPRLRPLPRVRSTPPISLSGPVHAPPNNHNNNNNANVFDKEVAKERILSRIATLRQLGNLEDILVDLVILEDRQLFAFYKAFWSCDDPDRFNRQLIRYAHSFAPKARAPSTAVRVPNTSAPSPVPNPNISTIRTNGRQLSATERMLLHDCFRKIRLRQMGESISMERSMLLEMWKARSQDIPAIHQRHTAAKKRKVDADSRQMHDQMHDLVCSIPGVTVPHPNRPPLR